MEKKRNHLSLAKKDIMLTFYFLLYLLEQNEIEGGDIMNKKRLFCLHVVLVCLL